MTPIPRMDPEQIAVLAKACASRLVGAALVLDGAQYADTVEVLIEALHAAQPTISETRAEVDAFLAPNWQPIVTAPKDGMAIIVYPTPLFGADQAGVAYWDRDEGYEAWRSVCDDERLDPEPTHWMPLPEAPETA